MIIFYISLYLIAGLLTGAAAYVVGVKQDMIWEGCVDGEEIVALALIITLWPLALSLSVCVGLGWLLFKCAEWLALLIMFEMEVRRGGKASAQDSD